MSITTFPALQYKVYKGSQNTITDTCIFIALMAKASNYMLRP